MFKYVPARLFLILVVCALVASACSHGSAEKPNPDPHQAHAQPSPSSNGFVRRIPAYFTEPPDPKSLPPTLDPAEFKDKVRDAYQAAKENPQLFAQLPCFCFCDKIGHKSLHSCYEDDHSTGCGICIDSALTAKQLKKEGLGAREIRDKLIAKYDNY
jgi:hypothetical protein